MWHTEKREWVDPLLLAAGVPSSEKDWVFLHSGLSAPYTGQYSILALRKSREISGTDFSVLEENLTTHAPALHNAWFGYLGYGLKNSLEKLPEDKPWLMHFPNLWMAQFNLILRFDHRARTIEVHAKTAEDFNHVPKPRTPYSYSAPEVTGLSSDMDKSAYLEKVGAVQESILKGNVYQANLTRKFTGEFREAPEPFRLFLRLHETSPAPYSAYIRSGERHILSSSPERFITITPEGQIESRPIKGTAPRSADKSQDIFNREQLQASTKNRSENLMIVDLMRNDLSKGSEIGSVRVSDLYDITTYSTIHHMSSAVQAKKRAEVSVLDVVKQCFPPGSMTGAPKIEAMRLCSELEPYARGVYSGAVGYFGGDGSVDLSVVIRTLLIEDTRFEFQVGGGIVEDSVPEEEWQETIAKARGVVGALGISVKDLEAL